MESTPAGRSFLGIRTGRLAATAAIAVSAAFLLCGYELVRSVSVSLFIAAYGARNLPIVMALGTLATLAFIYAYGRLLSVTGPRAAILTTSAFSALVILGCFAGIRAGARPATAVLYAFREAYIVLLVEQVWSFINSTVRTDEGSKLNGPVCGIASLGSITGGLFVQHYATQFGSVNLLLLAAITFVPTGLFAVVAYRAGGEPKPAMDEAHGQHGHLGLRTLMREPVLRRLALLIALTQVVSTVAELQLSLYAEKALPLADLRTQWFGGFYALLNMASAVCQFVIAPLSLAFVSHRLIYLAIPLVHLGMVAAVFANPGLWTAAACYLVFKVLDYSVFRAVKELLYVPLSFDARYRAKEIIDAFVYRASKGVTASGLAAVGRFVVLPMVTFPTVIAAALLGWLGVVTQLAQPHEGPPVVAGNSRPGRGVKDGARSCSAPKER
jgi:AAA family ATP:ADP antiporter